MMAQSERDDRRDPAPVVEGSANTPGDPVEDVARTPSHSIAPSTLQAASKVNRYHTDKIESLQAREPGPDGGAQVG